MMKNQNTNGKKEELLRRYLFPREVKFPEYKEQTIKKRMIFVEEELNRIGCNKLMNQIKECVEETKKNYDFLKKSFIMSNDDEDDKEIIYSDMVRKAGEFQQFIEPLVYKCKKKLSQGPYNQSILKKFLEQQKEIFKDIISELDRYCGDLNASEEQAPWRGIGLRFEQELLVKGDDKYNFENVLTAIKKYIKERAKKKRVIFVKPTLFISYAWPLQKNECLESFTQDFLRDLRIHLKKTGIIAFLDIKDNSCGGNIVQFMNENINRKYILLICTPSLYEKNLSSKNHALRAELSGIRNNSNDKVLPHMLAGTHQDSYPDEFKLYSTVRDFRSKSYVENIYGLITYFFPISEKKLKQIPEVVDFNENYYWFLSRMPHQRVMEMLEEKETAEAEKHSGINKGYGSCIKKYFPNDTYEVGDVCESNITANSDRKISYLRDYAKVCSKMSLNDFFLNKYNLEKNGQNKGKGIVNNKNRAICSGLNLSRLSNYNFKGSNFSKANFRYTLFSGFDFTGVKILKTRIDGADFTGVKGLTYKKLVKAKFSVDSNNPITSSDEINKSIIEEAYKNKKRYDFYLFLSKKFLESNGDIMVFQKNLQRQKKWRDFLMDDGDSVALNAFLNVARRMNEKS